MATRMQQRRGTASQWTASNPILNVGEIGFESDTNKFKIGDGTNHWTSLTYFVDAAQVSDIIDGAPALLDTLNELAAAIGDDPAFMTTVATNLSNHASDTTSVHGIANTADLATQEYVDLAVGNAEVDQSTLAGTGIDWNVTTDQFDIDSTVVTLTGTQNLSNKTLEDPTILVGQSPFQVNISATEISYLNGVTSSIQTQLDDKASATDLSNHSSDTTSVHGITDTSKLVATDAASTTLDGDLVVDGDFTVNGTNFAASATTIVIEDNMIQLAHQNSGNSVDLGVIVGYTEGIVAKHSGLVRDVSADSWKLFKGVLTEPTTTVDFTEGSLDDLAVAGLTASSISVGDVSNTEFGYLNGVTSAIQTQLDGKQGTVSGVSDTEIGYLDGVTSAIQTQLNAKAPLANPTFTGTVDLSGATVVGLPESGPTAVEIIMGVY